MGALLVLLIAQEPESIDDLIRLLQQAQRVFEMESEATNSVTETAAAAAAARLERPSTRRALWQALADPDLTPETRILVIQALQRLGEMSGFMETVAALAQFGAADDTETVSRDRETAKKRTQTAVQSIPGARTRNLAPSTPPPAADDRTARRNTVLGIAALCVVALLLLLRKGR